VELNKRLFVRSNRDLPFYCNPVVLFAIVWSIMLFTLSFHISYESYPDMSLPLLLFGISLVALLLGYWGWLFLVPASSTSEDGVAYILSVTKLRKLTAIFVLVALAIMILNVKVDGLPPALGLLSFDTKMYLEYGRLKQLLFPLLITLVVNSLLEPMKLRRYMVMAFGLLAMLLYITRGEILASLLQAFFVFSMTTKLKRRKLVLVSGMVALGLALAASIIGNNRTAQASFFEVLQIKQQFREWPMTSLWIISYFSIPLSNLCWIVRDFHFETATLSFLYPALPAFWTPAGGAHDTAFSSSHVIDGVHTYIANYYMDMSFVGVVLGNLVLGVGCAIIVRRGIGRHFLTSAIFLGCMAYIFFVDNFIPLSTLLQFAIQGYVQSYVLKQSKTVVAHTRSVHAVA
jgi:oligosaccharide repeat unit polymerase